MQNIKKGRVAGTQHAVGIDVRMRAAALTRDGVDAFHVFRAQVVEYFADDAHAFVFPHSRFHKAVKLFVCGIDHHAGGVEESDLVLGFDFSHLVHELLAIDDFDSLRLQGEQHGEFDDIDPHRLIEQFAFIEFQLDFFRQVVGQTGRRMGRAAQGRNARAGTLGQPRAVNLVMARRRTEIPNNRLIVLRQKRKSHELIHRPGADVGGSDIANVVHVEAEK